MSPVICVSKFKRKGKHGFSLGGVAKFAYYLGEATSIVEYEWADFPQWASLSEPKYTDDFRAGKLNDWLLAEKKIDDGSIVVVDGYWGSGLAGRVGRLISVVHGTYIGNCVQAELYPWSGCQEMPQQAVAQNRFWVDSGCELVAPCAAVADELKKLVGLDSYVIHHGIPLDIFSPRPGTDSLEKREVVLYVADRAGKGQATLGAMKDWMTEIGVELRHLAAKDGLLETEASHWRRGDLLFHPTYYEGCSYALLEAMACNLPVVTYAVGLATELDSTCGVVVDDHHPAAWRRALWKTLAGRFIPRQWVEDHKFDFSTFANNWKEFLNA